MQIFRKTVFLLATVMPLVLLCLCDGMLYMAGAILLHECAHLAALRLLGGRVRSFRAAPFGLCIAYDENTLSPRGEILVTAAGCFVNFLTAFAAILLYRLGVCDLFFFGIINALVGSMNLLPMEPLDGARLLQLVLMLFCMPDTATRIVQSVTYICSFLLFLTATYLLLTGQAGIYPILFSVYIFAENARRLSESRF